METAYDDMSRHAIDQADAGTIIVLGIESSCDETAASVLAREPDGSIRVLSSIIASQNEAHAPYGGVVPEIAARAHMQKIEGLIAQSIKDADIGYADLHAVAATAGPGLIGGVITGLMAAKGLALSLDIPLIAVNHLEGHALSPRLSEPCPFPYLLLLVSGGHTQLL
jgi:N6-L-threonylcarbamoyladenine synthase